MKRWICFLLFLLLLAACKAEPQNEWQVDELVKIDGKPVKMAEMAVYGIQVKKEFEQIGGRDIWEFESFSGGKSAYEVAKTKVLENLIRVKILAAKAEERKIELSSEEVKNTESRAKEFLADAKELEAAGAEIKLSDAKKVFAEFELGQKLKREMLRSFRPSAEMVENKLAADEVYQTLIKEEPREKYERYIIEVASLAINDKNKKQIEAIQTQLNENRGLTDELRQSMVYQEESYTKPELDAIYGEGFADGLRTVNEQLIMAADGTAYLYIKLTAMELREPDKLYTDLKKQEQRKQELRQQAEEAVRDESFDVIYGGWKKEADIQINQEHWQEFVVFLLPAEKK